MKDTWSKLNEVIQNVIGVSIVGVYLFMVVNSMEAPVELKAFVGAILIYFGFRIHKSKNNGENK